MEEERQIPYTKNIREEHSKFIYINCLISNNLLDSNISFLKMADESKQLYKDATSEMIFCNVQQDARLHV